MKMEGQILSKEHIKPSSPTPHHLKTHKLSLLDQIVPPIYVPLVLYYPNLDSNPKNLDFTISQTTQILKQSLSAILTRFYPLAGRVKDSLSIDCNDEGVLFAVAKFPYNLSDFLKKPDPKTCRDHIPSVLTWAEPGPGSDVAMIQVNYFDCGGIAIGSLFLHKVVDGVTVGTFMTAWATAAANGGGDEVVCKTISSNYIAQSFFPQNETMKRESHLFSAMRQYFKFGKTTMRRYVFDGLAISKLRAKLGSPEAGSKQRPTRVEAVSALIWKCFMIVSTKFNYSKSLVTHGVNIRRKADPPFHEHSFGNYVWLVPASSINSEADGDVKHLFGKVRNSINQVDVDFVTRMQGRDGFSGYCKNLQESLSGFPEDADYLAISSWCNFGLYGIDFGWGRPVWISKCDAGSDVEWPFFNVLWLMDTKEGDGIEAWLTLNDKYFEEFDKIEELRDLALVDPSPLDNGTVTCNGA